MGGCAVPTLPLTGLGGGRYLVWSKMYSHSLMAVRSLITMMPSASNLLATPAMPPPMVSPGILLGIPPGRGEVRRFPIMAAAADCGFACAPGVPLKPPGPPKLGAPPSIFGGMPGGTACPDCPDCGPEEVVVVVEHSPI